MTRKPKVSVKVGDVVYAVGPDLGKPEKGLHLVNEGVVTRVDNTAVYVDRPMLVSHLTFGTYKLRLAEFGRTWHHTPVAALEAFADACAAAFLRAKRMMDLASKDREWALDAKLALTTKG